MRPAGTSVSRVLASTKRHVQVDEEERLQAVKRSARVRQKYMNGAVQMMNPY